MSKYTCKDLKGKSFETKEDMYSALKSAKAEIVALKKSAIKFSDAVDFFIKSVLEDTGVAKSTEGAVKLAYGDFIYPVINTTNYLDSHGDVHIPGIWDKSVGVQQGKTYLIINHDLSLGNVIGYPKDVELMLKTLPWSQLGQGYEGETQALIFKTKVTEKSNQAAFMAYRDGEDIQHSIRMQYVKIELAINDSGERYTEEKAVWDKYISQIANKGVAIEQGFFWAVTEAKIYKEGSAVLFGSNDATPTLYDLEEKEFQPPTSTENKTEPPTSTQEREKSLLFNPNYI
jgi:hypothetical protein